MQRIHFTSDDLARTRVVPTLGRTVETLFALELLANGAGGTLFQQWRKAVHSRLGKRVQSLAPADQQVRPFPELLLLGKQTAKIDALLQDGNFASERSALAVRDFYRVALAPYWKRMHQHLETEREIRGRIVLSGGIERLLATLHPRMKWEPPYLLVPSERSEDVVLGGRGLVLAPSLFLSGCPRTIANPGGDFGTPALVYPAPPDRSQTDALWNVAAAEDRSLGALVGRTRAAMLEALTDSRASIELSRLLEISSAAVSQHTSILRNAGLIRSQRNVNTVFHTLTPLGVALLRGYQQERRLAAS
ncbi:ArsR/SmtB family transcription factor [Amycolatopsis antarctica]|nr:winged helix-turn-helix domain-containing protein [Amycolatopsis antarctica]